MDEWPLQGEDLETFLALDRDTRHLVLSLMGAFGEPGTDVWERLDRHPNRVMLASWLLELPAFRACEDPAEEAV